MIWATIYELIDRYNIPINLLKVAHDHFLKVNSNITADEMYEKVEGWLKNMENNTLITKQEKLDQDIRASVEYSQMNLFKEEESLSQQCHKMAKEHDFWSVPHDRYIVPAKLMLIVSEVVEAMDADRAECSKENKEQYIKNIGEELADIMIRVYDLSGYLNIDVDKVVKEKMKVNSTRPKRHGKRY